VGHSEGTGDIFRVAGGDIEELEDYELEHSCAFKQHSRVRRQPWQPQAGPSSTTVNHPSSPTTPQAPHQSHKWQASVDLESEDEPE